MRIYKSQNYNLPLIPSLIRRGAKRGRCVVVLIFFAIALNAHAISFASQADMTLAISPESPRPGEDFKVAVRSFVFEALRANMQWYLNGKVVASGRGVTEQTFVAGKAGTVINIKVRAIAVDGTTHETSVSIPISDIDLIARAQTYTPRGYRGIALPSPGSVLEIYAVPYLFSGGSKLAAKNLIYEWTINGEKFNGESGGGKTKFIADLPNFRGAQYDISLTVSNLSGAISATRQIKISTQNPEIVFYKSDSLMGRGVSALSSLRVPAGSALSVIAEPYFMAMDSLLKSNVVWKASGQNITAPSETPRLLEISAPQDSSGGSTNFSVSIEDTKKLFQRAAGNLTVSSQ